MQTERLVFEKLFTPDKVELASQKVELALVDDITKQCKLIEDMGAKIAIDGENALLLQSRVKDQGKFAVKEAEKLLQMEKEVRSAYTVIGKDFNKEFLNGRIQDAKLKVSNLQKRYNF